MFGVNFAIIGIENQEVTDYSIPLRNMSYDTGEYEKQALRLRREIRKNSKGLRSGGYLYGFRKKPIVSSGNIYLYSAKEVWDGSMSLHDILNFTDLPDELREMVADYKIHLSEIRKLKDTGVFKTDVRQVFDFIRCAEDKNALRELVEHDDYYKNMEKDAFDVAFCYTHAAELIAAKDREYQERLFREELGDRS